jgi:hypothetical protein
MEGKSPVKASEQQRTALEALAASRERGEADRARAVLLTLNGWTTRIAEAFGVRGGHGSPLAQRFNARGHRGTESERRTGASAAENRGRASRHHATP